MAATPLNVCAKRLPGQWINIINVGCSARLEHEKQLVLRAAKGAVDAKHRNVIEPPFTARQAIKVFRIAKHLRQAMQRIAESIDASLKGSF